MADVAIVKVDDWIGVYIDGRLDWEGHSMSTREFCERFVPDLRLIAAHDTQVERDAEDSGGLPETLAEVEDHLG